MGCPAQARLVYGVVVSMDEDGWHDLEQAKGIQRPHGVWFEYTGDDDYGIIGYAKGSVDNCSGYSSVMPKVTMQQEARLNTYLKGLGVAGTAKWYLTADYCY